MNRKSLRWLALGVICAGLLIGRLGTTADHIDSPAAIAEPAADITDIYAWVTSDKAKLNLIMAVSPNATAASKFSNEVKYVFHINSSATFDGARTLTQLICSFNEAQAITCKLGEDTVLVEEVDASATTGAASADGKFKVFAGLRDDPFYFELDRFNQTVKAVVDAAPNLTFNAANCPALDGATQTTLVNTLTGGTTNAFAGQNILAIVVQADKTLFGAGPFYGVSASTHK